MQISVRHWSHASNYTVRPNGRHILCISRMQLITASREREKVRFRFINCCKIKSGMENIFLKIDFTDFAFRILLHVYYSNNARGKFWLRMSVLWVRECVCVSVAPTDASVHSEVVGFSDSTDCTCRGYAHTHKYIHI